MTAVRLDDLPADVRDQLTELPLSCRLAYLVVREADEPLARSEIDDRTGLSSSGSRKALRRLEDADLVDSDVSWGNGRKKSWREA